MAKSPSATVEEYVTYVCKRANFAVSRYLVLRRVSSQKYHVEHILLIVDKPDGSQGYAETVVVLDLWQAGNYCIESVAEFSAHQAARISDVRLSNSGESIFIEVASQDALGQRIPGSLTTQYQVRLFDLSTRVKRQNESEWRKVDFGSSWGSQRIVQALNEWY